MQILLWSDLVRRVAGEMKIIGKSLGNNFTDYKTNSDMLNELIIASVIKKIRAYKSYY